MASLKQHLSMMKMKSSGYFLLHLERHLLELKDMLEEGMPVNNKLKAKQRTIHKNEYQYYKNQIII